MHNLTEIIDNKANLIQRQISMEKDIESGSRKAASIISEYSDIQKYTDIIVDISAMPTSLYFPMIGKILHLLDKEKEKSKVPNLHLVVAENTLIDSLIADMEISDRARYLFSFTSDLETESTKKHKIWIPILGENQGVQLDRIKTLVEPSEICPLLPSPSDNPRRADNLIIEYREHFDKMKVEIHNIIHGAEQNPFEVYRQILATIYSYQEALESLGGCKVAISKSE